MLALLEYQQNATFSSAPAFPFLLWHSSSASAGLLSYVHLPCATLHGTISVRPGFHLPGPKIFKKS